MLLDCLTKQRLMMEEAFAGTARAQEATVLVAKERDELLWKLIPRTYPGSKGGNALQQQEERGARKEEYESLLAKVRGLEQVRSSTCFLSCLGLF